VFVALAILMPVLLVLFILRRWTRWRPAILDRAEPTDHATREDMIHIWTEINGIPLKKAESMWESYERAKAVTRLGLKSK